MNLRTREADDSVALTHQIAISTDIQCALFFAGMELVTVTLDNDVLNQEVNAMRSNLDLRRGVVTRCDVPRSSEGFLNRRVAGGIGCCKRVLHTRLSESFSHITEIVHHS